MEATELIKHFKYGTLEIMAKDLADQIEEHDKFFTGDQTPDAQDIIRHARTVIAFGQVIKIYCGEGGIPICDLYFADAKSAKHYDGLFERLVDKYHPEIKDDLRKKW